MTVNESIALELMALSPLLDSDPGQVRRRASALLPRAPENRALALLLAAAHLKLGEAAAAVGILEPWAEREAASASLQLTLGRAYRSAGRAEDAISALRWALALDEALEEAWRELAAQLFSIGDEAGGDAAYLRYSRLAKLPVELARAATAILEGRLEAADLILEQHLAAAPGDSPAWRLRGDVAAQRKEPTSAEGYFMRCLAIAPGDSLARYGLACALHELNRSEEALPLLDRLLRVEPDEPRYLEFKAKALRQTMRDDEALALLEQATERQPDAAGLLLLYGHILREAGRLEEAIEVYRRATALSVGAGNAWWCLAGIKTYAFSDTELASMRELLNSGRAQGPDRTHLEFALGKALENTGDYEQSFQHYATGNALHRGTFAYRPLAVERTTALMCQSLTPEFFEHRRGWGSDRADPIFIVGLPRSGSTLLEQILASHSQVEGTHELADIPTMSASLVYEQNDDGTVKRDPFAALTAADVDAFAARYLQSTARMRRRATARFTDKQLGNFRNLGLIHLMFPRATVIDMRRHPMACGFACYKQHFARLLPFCYDLAEVGRYYRDYVYLMDRLDAALPGRVHRVYYEQLVADPEAQVRKLLDICGLPFESDCLRFYTNERVVRTISADEVRRPIYQDSVEQWRHYEPWLGPLREALGDLVETYPGTAG